MDPVKLSLIRLQKAVSASLYFQTFFNNSHFSKIYCRATFSTFSNQKVIKDEIENVYRRLNIKCRLQERKYSVPVYARKFKLNHEIKEPLTGITHGTIPDWINGSLVRNGPGGLTVGNYTYNHWFDAAAVLHRFNIKNGSATYQNRFLKTKTLEKNHAAQRIVVSEFGTRSVPDPCQTLFQRFTSFFKQEEMTDNCNVSIYPFGDEVYALTEAPVMYRIDPESLQTFERVNLNKFVNIIHHTAHPHVGHNGLVSNIGLSVGRTGTEYLIVEFPHTKIAEHGKVKDVTFEGRIAGRVKCRWPLNPSYMHSFGVTDSYYIIVEQPYALCVPELITSKFNPSKPFYKMMKWHENYPVQFHVVAKDSGEHLHTFISETFFFFHTINQYEEDNHIVFDICVYEDTSIIDHLDIESLNANVDDADLSKGVIARPARFVLPLTKQAEGNGNLVTLKNTNAKAYPTAEGKINVIPEILVDIGCEIPKVYYPQYNGKPYRYFYAIGYGPEHYGGTLVKVDVKEKTKKIWIEDGVVAGEPMFVPSPNPKEEDDGVVLSTLLWKNDETKVALIVFDARNFVELGRTVFQTPGPAITSLHGWYFSGK